MLNKILLRKIKFPLSWRGAKSTMSLRGAKRRSNLIRSNLNLSGFSLIELMVAVVILALAILGIFQAYSVGFMGMADARDRTVATNYLQQTLEDFKNMDFNQVKNEPITPIPGTKFSRGTYVQNLEKIDDVVTLKKVISQVRWIDRQGNIKTEKASTIIYNKPATSEVSDEAVELVLYAQPYYTILPTNNVNLIAEIKDENGNIYDWDGEIIFSVVTVRDADGNPLQVGDISTEPPIYANDGVANCIFTAFAGENIEGIERIQATATVGGNDLTDTVNIRVTTGPVGIVIMPASEEDRVLAAGTGVLSHIMLYVVRADYDYLNPVAYESPITLSTDIGSPGTLSTTTIASVPTDGVSFILTSNGIPGVVEITASAPDLDIGYTEIIFTGEPTSILITPDKNSIYPGENIGIKVTIVDVNKVPVEFSGTVTLKALIDNELTVYGIFDNTSNPITLDYPIENFLKLIFKTSFDSPVGKTIAIQANAGALSGSTNITILSSLTPKYLKLFVYPESVDLNGVEEKSTKITATVYDDSFSEIVTTYNTPITFYAKVVVGGVEADFGGTFSDNDITPKAGEAEAILSSDVAGTVTITASSGGLVLRPEGGIEVIFYTPADHIELSADPSEIEANGHETSIITATICDEGGNRVANYGNDPNNPKTITLSLTDESEGTFINNLRTIDLSKFDEGVVTTSLSSSDPGTAMITALSSDGLSDDGSVSIALTGNILSVLTLGNVSNLDDHEIHFGITVTGSPIYLTEIQIEWNDPHAELDEIIIRSPFGEESPLIIPTTDGSISPCTENITTAKKLVINDLSDIGLIFSGAKMNQNTITVTFTEDDGITTHDVSFRVPNI